MFGLRPRPRFDPDTLSSIWVMACRDDSPILTAFSVAYRLGGITPEEVIELVKGRQELFRLGLTPGQSRNWKAKYRPAPPTKETDAKPAGRRRKPAPQPYPLPDWLQVFDDEGPPAEQDRVREWLHNTEITSSQQALESFLDDGFVIDEVAFRSQFRIDRELAAEPSDLATVNWGLEHIDRLRRGRADIRQNLVALTTGIGGVAIGALVALTAPMVTTIYQGRPADTARLTIDHQARLDGYGALSKSLTGAERAAKVGDAGALAGAMNDVASAATTLSLLLDPDSRKRLQEQQVQAVDACTPPAAPAPDSSSLPCLGAISRFKQLLVGPLTDAAIR